MAAPQKASDWLKTQIEPWRVSVFGDRLHVVVDHPDLEIPRIEARLREANIVLKTLRTIPFSLEDAFIGIVQRASS